MNTETPITAKEIVDRYAGQPGDKLLPFQSPEKYNRNIKIIFEKAGITYLVTTLNTRTRKEETVPINTIACSRYRTIDMDMKKDLVKILEGKQ